MGEALYKISKSQTSAKSDPAFSTITKSKPSTAGLLRNLSLATPRHLHFICHLRLEKSITCDSSPFWIQTRKGMGCGRVGWDVNAPSHLQTKKALAHIHVEQGVGWGGMSTFPGTCKPRLVHIHVEQRVGRGGILPFPGTCKSNKGWCRVGCCPSLAIRNPAKIKVGKTTNSCKTIQNRSNTLTKEC